VVSSSRRSVENTDSVSEDPGGVFDFPLVGSHLSSPSLSVEVSHVAH